MPGLEEADPDLAKFGKLLLAGTPPLEAGVQVGWDAKQTKNKHQWLHRYLERYYRGKL
jgi:hypothetical protein